jgi:hypothetical protein
MNREVLIRIEPDPAVDGYKASLFNVAALGLDQPALAEGPFEVSPELLALRDLLSGNTPASDIDDKGLDLYRPLYAALGQPLQQVLAQEDTVIHFDLDSEDLRGLPWEILVWPEDAGGAVRMRATHPICRVNGMRWDAPQLVSNGPLRLMIAISNAAGISAAEEATEIRRRVQPNERAVDILQIQPKDKKTLYDEIKSFRPHVFHFIGHGTTGSLDFGPWDWKRIEFGDVGGIALEKWKPCLVFLNACRSAKSSDSVTFGVLAPLGSRFLARGAQAAIAMQGDIQGVPAGTLAGVFYERLAAGCPIHLALSEARAAVEVDFDSKQACYPALMMRCPSRAALPYFHPLPAEYRQRVKLCDILPKLRVFINQVEPRREVYRSLWPYDDEQLREPFILLRGPSLYGKTMLAGALLDLAVRLGHRVRYVDFSLEPTVDFVSTLERIWGGRPSAVLRSPLFDPLPVFSPADWEKRFCDAVSATDLGIYAEFRKALADISANQPLTLVLDHFRLQIMPQEVFWYLWENLFLHVGRDLGNINLVVVLDEDAYDGYEVEKKLTQKRHFAAHKPVKLGPLNTKYFESLWKEYMYFRSDDLRKVIEDPDVAILVASQAAREKDPISVAQLENKTQALVKAMQWQWDLPKFFELRP